MYKKLKYTIITVLFCCVWLISPVTPTPLSENMTARAASTLWNGNTATSFAGGTGTQADPYLISTAEQLAYFSQQVNSGITYLGQYIKLTQDILLNEMNSDGTFVSTMPKEFTCIGNTGSITGNSGGFMGSFDGDGKRVTGLYINKPDIDVQGLFGFANDNSVIKSLGVIGSVTGRDDVGGVAGRTRGLIDQCFSECKVTGRDYVAGVTGNADQHSIVRNCYNKGSVTGTSYVGGVAGVIDKSSVKVDNNYSSGTVTGTTNVGGVAGYNFGGTVWNNYYDTTKYSGGGINSSDVATNDGAVGYNQAAMQGVSVVNLLNTNNPDGTVWILDTPVINDGYPILGVHAPLTVVSYKIATGKQYTSSTLTSNTPVTVTSDSVFTAGFSMRYNSSYNLAAQTIGLSVNDTAVQLPAGASIIMLADGSYYYINLATAAGKISLGEFIKMGTAVHYAPATQAQANDVKDYLFIFDFTKTSSLITSGTYQVKLLTAEGEDAGSTPTVTTAGVNTFALTASGSAGLITANFSKTAVTGYDYKTDGKIYGYELHLEQGGSPVSWPIGTKINGTAISSVLPYVFTSAAFGSSSISIDMLDCVNPLTPGSYTAVIKAYACTDTTVPRSGWLLASGSTAFTLESPTQYAIRISAPTRVFDQLASAIPVAFNINTLGSGTVKSTLQRKYGEVYVNITGQTDLPVSISGSGATLTIPAGYEKGTYRFAITLYDGNNTARAQAVESVIIK